MIRIAVDAMGGDRAPAEVVQGAVMAASAYGLEIALVGDQDSIRADLTRLRADSLPLTIVHADQVVEMHEHPVAAVKAKKRSSIVVAMELAKSGEVDAVVSAGNSGAVTAAALFVLGRIGGIERPAISTILPTPKRNVMLLDIGANADCRPQYLLQFAIMGSLYVEKVLGAPNPTVALLSNGEEATKGNLLTQETYQLLQKTNLNFIGNIEGKDLPHGVADVVVTDGFVGNVTLKLSEGLSEVLLQMVREELNRDVVSRLAALAALPAFRRLKRRIDYTEVGGAPLLGVEGVCIVAHGRSNAKAISSAVRLASQAAEQDIVEVIRRGIQASLEGDLNVRRSNHSSRTPANTAAHES